MITQLPPRRPMPADRAAQRQQLIEASLSGTSPRPAILPWFRRQLVRRFALAGGAAVLLATGTAAAIVVFDPTDPVDGTRCYTVASLDGGDDFPGTTVALAHDTDGQRRRQATTDMCAFLWEQGFLVEGSALQADPDRSVAHPVPPLVACRLDTGMPAVFPGDPDTCARLNIIPL